MKMYTEDGTEVLVVKKIEEGYLAKRIYYGYLSEDHDEEIEEACEQIEFFERLFTEPPTEKIADAIVELTGKKELLEHEVSSLQLAKRNEASLLNKVSQYPFVQKLVDYLTGDFKYYMWLNGRYELENKEGVYYSRDAMKVIKFKGDTFKFYKLKYENSDSYDDRSFMVFNTPEEAVEYALPIIINDMESFINDMESYRSHEGWSSSTFMDNMGKIRNNAIKTDPRYVKCYDEVYAFIVAREQEKQKERLKKEIEELDAKRKKLEELQSK